MADEVVKTEEKMEQVKEETNDTPQEEQKRVSRLNVYDQRHGQAYEKIHSMLLR